MRKSRRGSGSAPILPAATQRGFSGSSGSVHVRRLRGACGGEGLPPLFATSCRCGEEREGEPAGSALPFHIWFLPSRLETYRGIGGSTLFRDVALATGETFDSFRVGASDLTRSAMTPSAAFVAW